MVDDAGDPVASAATPAGPTPTDDRLSGPRLWSVALILGIAFAALAGLYLAITALFDDAPELRVVILLLAGLAVVTLILYLGTLVLRALDLAVSTEALGMPTGSIRALIAVLLILLFAIVGFVVFRSASTGTQGTSHGITQAQIDKIRADGATIVSQSLVTPAPGQSAPAAGEAIYDVETVSGLTADAHDFGLQLLSTTITLVVAVAGFYFGAQTVNQAGKDTREQLGLIQAARAARRAEIIGAVPEPAGGPAPEDRGDEPEISDVDGVDGPDGPDGPDDGNEPPPDGAPDGGPETTPDGGPANPPAGEAKTPPPGGVKTPPPGGVKTPPPANAKNPPPAGKKPA
ncbi:MAG TPA: hypothetical protein VFJ71_08500 [Candidatus Limnocylindrales bacterium]|nr:hypothetical protein [Candidatus Limnocylindrales bacterium]